LGTVGAIKALAAVLRSPQTPEPLAIDVIRSLCWMEQQAAVVELGQIWSSHHLSPPLRQAICEHLGRIETPHSQAPAVTQLMDWLAVDPTVASAAPLCQAIITALGGLGDTRAIDLLIQQFAIDEPRQRLHLVAALKQIDRPLAHDRLTQVAQSTPDPILRQAIAQALEEW
jgi:HEAT repeat protein